MNQYNILFIECGIRRWVTIQANTRKQANYYFKKNYNKESVVIVKVGA